MSEKAHPWDQRDNETPQAYAAFQDYCLMGPRRTVRGAARHHYANSESKGEQITTVRKWLVWSAAHDWVARSKAREKWIADTSDQQIANEVASFKVELAKKVRQIIKKGNDQAVVRASRALALHFPPVQRIATSTEEIEDLSDLSDSQLEEMKRIRDEARKGK